MNRTVKILVFCCFIFASGCISSAVKPITDPGFTGFENDDANIRARAVELATRIDESGFLYNAPELETYLNKVARKILPNSAFDQIQFRIKILRDPMLNAFALANGSVYLHTGILASMENEAQLAALLGHEMTHVTNRHNVRELRDLKNKVNVFGALFVATGGLATVLGPVAQATIMGHSRDLERESDVEGFRLAAQAGYDTTESIKLFEALKHQIEREKIKESYFFGSHPRIMERIESYQTLIASLSPGRAIGVKNEADFQQHVKLLILDNVQLLVQSGRYEWAIYSLQKYIERYPDKVTAWFLLGEANRQLGEGKEKAAREAYQKAIHLDSNHADAHKMLGITLLKSGDKNSARQHLEKYLALNAGAKDRTYIERYIKECEK